VSVFAARYDEAYRPTANLRTQVYARTGWLEITVRSSVGPRIQ
jgi:hypothetical protein